MNADSPIKPQVHDEAASKTPFYFFIFYKGLLGEENMKENKSIKEKVNRLEFFFKKRNERKKKWREIKSFQICGFVLS